ncbi:MAG: bacteriophage abortive infection AbiH family protein [Bdellovibrionales bacterium]|nr:bacteriophage abortive infection AbiH family protein [Bdellovibrionales bacterium]
MKKIIIIGNGFDINLGLPTAYSDFLRSELYLKLLKSGNQMALFLSKQNSLDRWVDVEVGLNTYADLVCANEDNLPSFKKEYKELLSTFLNYLNSLDLNSVNAESDAYKFIFENSIANGAISDTMFFNFNYTPTVRSILTKVGWSRDEIASRHNHVHGELTSKVVFGIQDNSKTSKFHTFVKKSAAGGFAVTHLSDQLTEPYDVFIFGYSLGLTDEMYFKSPFLRLAISPRQRTKMHIYHYGEEALDDIKHRIDELTNHQLSDFQKSFEIIPKPIQA